MVIGVSGLIVLDPCKNLQLDLLCFIFKITEAEFDEIFVPNEEESVK